MSVKGISRKKIKYFVLIIVVLAIAITYTIKKKTFLNKELPQLVEKRSKNLYIVKYDSIAVSELKGDVFIKNLSVFADTLQQNALLKNDIENAPKILIKAFIPSIHLTGFKTAGALISKRIVCDKIIITNPTISALLYSHKTRKDIIKQKQELYKQLLGNFELIEAKEIEIIDADFACEAVTGKQKIFKAVKTSINLSDVRIDSIANQDTTRTFFCKKVIASTGIVTIGNSGKSINVFNAGYNTTNETFSVSKIQYDGMKSGENMKTSIENVSISEIRLMGPTEGMFVSTNKIAIDKCYVETKKKEKDASAKSTKSKAPSKILPPWLKQVSLNSFNISDITFKQVAAKPGEKDLDIKKTSVAFTKVRLDSSSNTEQPVTELFEELKVNNPEIAIVSKDKLYKFSFSKIDCNSKNKTIRLKDFSAVPTLSEQAFAKKAGVMKDRYDMRLNDVVCSNVDFNGLLKGEINIGSVATSNSYFKVFLDISYPPANENKVGKYPNQLLFNVKSPVHVEKIILKNIFIEYKERTPRSDSSGRVTFENSNLIITNITNRPKGKNDICEWNFTSKLLGKIPVRSTMRFYLNEHEKGKFDIEGSMEQADLKVLNIISRPMGLMNFDRGYANSAGFNLTGDNYTFKGNVSANYQDLKISLLKLKESNKVKKKTVVSIIANLLIKGSNKKKEANQNVQVTHQRVTTKSFFYNLWKSIFKGIRDILVLGP